jgi:hypothetical protein
MSALGFDCPEQDPGPVGAADYYQCELTANGVDWIVSAIFYGEDLERPHVTATAITPDADQKIAQLVPTVLSVAAVALPPDAAAALAASLANVQSGETSVESNSWTFSTSADSSEFEVDMEATGE